MTTKVTKITQHSKSSMVGIGTYVAIGVNSDQTAPLDMILYSMLRQISVLRFKIYRLNS